MPQGDKSSYTSKQKRQAQHIEEGYEKRGTSKKEAERRAGPPSTRKPAVAKRAAPDGAKASATQPRAKAAASRIPAAANADQRSRYL